MHNSAASSFAIRRMRIAKAYEYSGNDDEKLAASALISRHDFSLRSALVDFTPGPATVGGCLVASVVIEAHSVSVSVGHLERAV